MIICRSKAKKHIVFIFHLCSSQDMKLTEIHNSLWVPFISICISLQTDWGFRSAVALALATPATFLIYITSWLVLLGVANSMLRSVCCSSWDPKNLANRQKLGNKNMQNIYSQNCMLVPCATMIFHPIVPSIQPSLSGCSQWWHVLQWFSVHRGAIFH